MIVRRYSAPVRIPRRWPFARTITRPAPRRRAHTAGYSIADPVLAQMLGWTTPNSSGQSVSESTALTLSAVFRAMDLIGTSVAGLPLQTLDAGDDGTQVPVGSFLDNPAGPDRATPFEWAELVTWHLGLQGNAFLQHVYNRGGAICGLNPIHPLCVSVDEDLDLPGGKRFTVDIGPGEAERVFDASTMTHICGPSQDGLRGMSRITLARNSLGTALAGDKAAGRLFANGALISGMVTPDEDYDEEDTKEAQRLFRSAVQGEENAGEVAFINRRLKFTPWQLSSADAQFLESRTFQIDEIGRWWGVPPHLLGLTEKASSWGQGIAEQNRGLARYTLKGYTGRIEQRVDRLVPSNRTVAFDYSAFTAASPEEEQASLIALVAAGIITPNEARRKLNRPPIMGGDVLRTPAGAAPPPAPAAAGPAGPELVPDVAA